MHAVRQQQQLFWENQDVSEKMRQQGHCTAGGCVITDSDWEETGTAETEKGNIEDVCFQ